jgi:hypothetical protein
VTSPDSPSSNPDYIRFIEATKLVEREVKKSSPKEMLKAFSRRFSYEVAARTSTGRIDSIMESCPLEEPDDRTLARYSMESWMEGFTFGVWVYVKESRGRIAQEFMDQIAMINVHHLIRNANQDERSSLYSTAMPHHILVYVALSRAGNVGDLKKMFPLMNHQRVRSVLSGTWLDGFLMGIVYEELGGRRS